MRITTKPALLAASAGVILLAASACGSGTTGSSASSAPASAPAAALGAPKPASGTPVVLGMINLESGPVTFPEVRAGAQAAAAYLNAYRGGIGGHPIKLVTCVSDGQPATSAQCANQILDQHPVAVIGGADTGAPAAMAVWQRAGLPYLGGMTLTPAENTAPDSVQFYSVSVGDNAAASVFAATTLHAKSASVLYTDDTQGAAVANTIIAPTMQHAGIGSIKKVNVPPAAADVSAQAATAVSTHPDVIYINTPNACANVLRALQTVGSTAKLVGIDPCADPAAIKAAGAAADGLYIATPIEPIDGGGQDASLFRAAMAKYAPARTTIGATTVVGFGSMMNVQAALDALPTAQLTKAGILSAFRTGGGHPNFMGHPYTCDGKQLGHDTAVCNAYQLMYQIKGGRLTLPSQTWVTAGQYFTG